MPKKYVLTGGPCTGKTTTLLALLEKGFRAVPEVPRMIIEGEQANNGTILPWKDFLNFQKTVLQKQIELESDLQDHHVAFLDRGVPDQIAYCRLQGTEVPIEILEAVKSNRYDRVFLLDRLPVYETDSARKEDPKTAERLHQLIREAYLELDYDVVSVPPVSVQKRIEFILSSI